MSDRTDALPELITTHKSAYNTFFPPFIKEIAYQMLDKTFLGLSEPELEVVAKHPCPEDLYELRNRFWFEYYSAQAAGLEMRNESIVPAHIPIHSFIDYLFRDHRIYFLLLPPKNYVSKMSEVLDRSLDNFMTIQKVSPVLPNGTVDFKLAELQLKIHVILDNRKHGAPTQRMHAVIDEQKNVQITNSSDKPIDVDALLDQKLKEIDEKISQGKALVAKDKTKNLEYISVTPQVLDEPTVPADPIKNLQKSMNQLNRVVRDKLNG